MAAEEVEALVERWVAAFNAVDLDAVSALYAEGCRYVVGSLGIDVCGRDAQRRIMADFAERLPDRRISVRRVIASASAAAVEADYTATSRGGEGMPPIGSQYRSECCFLLTVEDGLIVHERDYIDRPTASA